MKDKIFKRAHLFYAVAVPLCLAFVLTVAMFIKMRAWEQERTTLTFERQTATLGQAIEKSIDSYLEVLYAVGSF